MTAVPDLLNRFDTERARSLEHLIRMSAQRDPDAACIVATSGQALTWRQLVMQLERTQATLRSFGLGVNDRVAIVLPDGPTLAVAFLSVARCAACAPLNPAYKLDELLFYLSDLKARALIVAPGDGAEASRSAAARLGIPVLELHTDRDAPGLFSLTSDGAPGGSATSGAVSGDGVAASDDIALLLHTSGTTSRPKLVPLRQCNLVASAHNIISALALSPADRCLNLMPLFHIHGLVGGLLAPLAAAGSVVCPQTFRPGQFFHWLETTQPSWYTAVPTMHRAIVAEAKGRSEAVAPGRLRFIRSSSSALPAGLFNELTRIFRVPVIEAYSMTEAAHQMTCNPLAKGQQRPGTVGLPAGPAVAIVDPAGHPLPVGQTGEVVIRGPSVMDGYEANPQANAEAFVNGWFRTGDLGRLDSDGYLTLAGRLKEQINRGGEKISPIEIDQALLSHPDISEATAFGFPHPTLGEEIAAAIVPRPHANISPAAIQDFLSQRLAPFKVPRRVLVLDAIPKGPTGKVQRRQLSSVLKLGATESCQNGRAGRGPISALEQDLLLLWRRTLNCDALALDDDFFEKGGDSLLAVQMLFEVETMIGREVPESILFANSTIRQLAQALAALDAPRAVPVVQLHAAGTRPPLFFFHGDYTGRGFYTRPFARELGEDQPLVSVAPHGLGREVVPASFEQMAVERLPLLLSMQPQGPYRLGGYCSGAMVALEVARLLVQDGQRVALVAMIDSPTLNLRPTMRAMRRGIGKLLHAANRDMEDEHPRLAAAMDSGWRYLTEIERVSLASIAKRPLNAYRTLRHTMSELLGGSEASAGGRGMTSRGTRLTGELGKQDRQLAETYTRLYRSYFPEGVDVPIVYFSASYGGRPVSSLSPNVEIVNVPGGHTGCITAKVEVLARHLRQRLDRLNA